MDLLTDLLRQSGLQQRVLDLGDFADGEVRRFPCGRSFGFHLVLEGAITVRPEAGGEPIPLGPGDVAFMTRGCHHALHAEGVATVMSAAYLLPHAPVHPLFRELPNWCVVPAPSASSGDRLRRLADLLREERREAALGSEAALHALIEAAFVQVLRRIVEGEGARPLSLAAALRAPGIRQALERLHASPEHDWSLEGLADVAGLSRSAFAAKFKTLVGESPLGYLRGLRVQRAMGLLVRPGASIVAVANAVGYGDPFVFSKAFKKVVGVSPREFRASAALEGLPAAS
jgi:AraC-like DNA-binding protein